MTTTATLERTTEVPVHHHMTPARRLEAALTTLGNTPNAVAQTLYDAGIRGEAGCSERCALANWLTHAVGLEEVRVCADQIIAEVPAGNGRVDAILRITPGPALAGFIAGFDNGNYRDLVDTGVCITCGTADCGEAVPA